MLLGRPCNAPFRASGAHGLKAAPLRFSKATLHDQP